MGTLLSFVRESNMIEGILRSPTKEEVEAHNAFLNQPVTLGGLEDFVRVVAPGKPLRREMGMDVRVGNHVAPPGGPDIEPALRRILARAGTTGEDPYAVHVAYEMLHPFMDGNGRSGRALWLWMMLRRNESALGISFLHRWYYQSLAANQ